MRLSQLKAEHFLRFLLVLLAIAVAAGTFRSGFAQVIDTRWTQPYQLSSVDADAETVRTALVADAYGMVHSFWGETSRTNGEVSLLYSRFDGTSWTNPTQISSGQGEAIRFPQAYIDEMDQIHLVWSGSQSGPLFYMTAPLSGAERVQNWSKPLRIDLPVHTGRIQVDQNDVMHLVYSSIFSETPGIFYTRSSNGGLSWETPITIYTSDRPNQYPASLQVDVSQAGEMHLVAWFLDQAGIELGNAQVVYAGSSDGGNNWSEPRILARQTTDPTTNLGFASPVIAVNNEMLLIVWVQGELPYRNYLVSYDSGVSWSPSRKISIFQDLHGSAGDALVYDNSGRMHYFTQIRYPMGIWHATWEPDRWSRPQMIYQIASNAFEGTGNNIHVHQINASSRLGNQIVLTFNNSPSDPQVITYNMNRVLDDVPAAPIKDTPVPTPTIQPSATPVLVTPTITPLPESILALPQQLDPSGNKTFTPILFALIPVFALLVGVIAYRFIQKK